MFEENQHELTETVIQIKRTSKKTKGGNRLSFTALAVVGDQQGRVGTALSKAPIVLSAIKKAQREARKYMFSFPLVGEAKTIPHRVELQSGASRVLLKPAPAGTGIRAGQAVRAVLEAGGIKNVVTKILGSGNIKGNVDATVEALQSLRDPGRRILQPKAKPEKKKRKSAKA